MSDGIKSESDLFAPLRVRAEGLRFDHVVYHANCPDGFGAAWTARRALGKETVTTHALQHGDPLPAAVMAANARVLFADIAPRRALLTEMHAAGVNVAVVDHHISALEDLRGMDGIYFDMARSGMRLVWDLFNQGVPPPRLVQMIEDRDLWLWKVPGSREFTTFMGTLPFDFDIFESYASDESLVDDAIEKGKTILEETEAAISTHCIQYPSQRMFEGHRIMVTNSSSSISEIGNRFAKMNGIDYGMVWMFDPSKRTLSVSLRSMKEKVDVSKVAQSRGGGGHYCASGFRFNSWIEALFGESSDASSVQINWRKASQEGALSPVMDHYLRSKIENMTNLCYLLPLNSEPASANLDESHLVVVLNSGMWMDTLALLLLQKIRATDTVKLALLDTISDSPSPLQPRTFPSARIVGAIVWCYDASKKQAQAVMESNANEFAAVNEKFSKLSWLMGVAK